MSNTFLLSPFILNGRIVNWLFLPDQETFYLRVFVRNYASPGVWHPQGCDIEFTQRTRFFVEDSDSAESVSEVFYECTNPRIMWDREGFPVLRR